ncbi:MAG TPA: hypothetical protein DEP35_18775 [Deltaproteobacteria bacterium]|nr:hypothetical protein [Deltaproteobacteria bacterium]
MSPAAFKAVGDCGDVVAGGSTPLSLRPPDLAALVARSRVERRTRGVATTRSFSFSARMSEV